MTENGTEYSVASLSDAGAGNLYEEKVYALVGTSPCLAVRTFIHSTNIANYDPGTVTAFDEAALTGAVRRHPQDAHRRAVSPAVSAEVDPPLLGVLLAGGAARRMGGGDKCLLLLGGRPLLAHAIDRLTPQVDAMVLSANGDPDRFAAFGLPVVADPIPGSAGPLAGILGAMLWARRHRPDVRQIVSVATDTPFFPDDLVARLSAAAGKDAIAIARSGGRDHRVFGVFPVDLRRCTGAVSEDARRPRKLATGSTDRRLRRSRTSTSIRRPVSIPSSTSIRRRTLHVAETMLALIANGLRPAQN